MKERENREFWIRQTTVLLAMSINRYLYISFIFLLQGFFGCNRSWIRLNQTVQGPSFPLHRLTGQDILIKILIIRARCVFVSQKLLPGGRYPLDPLKERGKETMARPRLGEEERRGRTVGVRVTEAEAEELQERAQGGAPLGGRVSTPAGAGAAGTDGGGAAAWGRRSYGS